ncbi:hypothetical protein WJX72_006205 [[Myrmecia] bisecta]|uniref:Exonuclease domain-containing protein n=1 Tax=[Myrmecia] bisecta TaxID=41462 RepID=A0AAW1QFC6_9CHLO
MAARNYFAALTSLTHEEGSDEDTPAQQRKTKRTASSKNGQTSSAQNFLAAAAASLSLDQARDASKSATTSAAAAAEAPDGRNLLHLPLIWLDLEMTGLDLDRDTIVEIACIVTDGDMRTVIEGPALAIHHPESVLTSMNAWCIEHHGASGLTQRVRESTISMQEAEQQVLKFVQRHTEPKLAQLAGNSVHVDLAFLRKHMPLLAEHIPHRIVDVSTVVELARRWFPKAHKQAPKKKAAHTALSDIRESISELRYYRDAVFKPRHGR